MKGTKSSASLRMEECQYHPNQCIKSMKGFKSSASLRMEDGQYHPNHCIN